MNVISNLLLQKFGESLSPLQRCLEDVNDQVAVLSSNDVYISPSNLRKVEDLNSRYVIDLVWCIDFYMPIHYFSLFLFPSRWLRRWKYLQTAMDKRYKQIREVGKSGPSSVVVPNQNFLVKSVDPPWERAVTQNKVPYYIK